MEIFLKKEIKPHLTFKIEDKLYCIFPPNGYDYLGIYCKVLSFRKEAPFTVIVTGNQNISFRGEELSVAKLLELLNNDNWILEISNSEVNTVKFAPTILCPRCGSERLHSIILDKYITIGVNSIRDPDYECRNCKYQWFAI